MQHATSLKSSNAITLMEKYWMEHIESQNFSNTPCSITDCWESLTCNDQKMLPSPKGISPPIFFLAFLAFPSLHPRPGKKHHELVPSFHTQGAAAKLAVRAGRAPLFWEPRRSTHEQPGPFRLPPAQPPAQPCYLLFAVPSTSAGTAAAGIIVSPARGMLEEEVSALFISLEVIVKVIDFC